MFQFILILSICKNLYTGTASDINGERPERSSAEPPLVDDNTEEQIQHYVWFIIALVCIIVFAVAFFIAWNYKKRSR